MVVVGLLAIDAFLNAGLAIYNSFRVAREVPLKGFFQVAKIVSGWKGLRRAGASDAVTTTSAIASRPTMTRRVLREDL